MYDKYSATCFGTEVPPSVGPSDQSSTGPTRQSGAPRPHCSDYNSATVQLDGVVRCVRRDPQTGCEARQSVAKGLCCYVGELLHSTQTTHVYTVVRYIECVEICACARYTPARCGVVGRTTASVVFLPARKDTRSQQFREMLCFVVAF